MLQDSVLTWTSAVSTSPMLSISAPSDQLSLPAENTAGHPSSPPQSPGASAGLGVWGTAAAQLDTHLYCAGLARAQVCSTPQAQRDHLCPASKNKWVSDSSNTGSPPSNPTLQLLISRTHLVIRVLLCSSMGARATHRNALTSLGSLRKNIPCCGLSKSEKKTLSPSCQGITPLEHPDLLHLQSCSGAPVGQAPPQHSDWGTGPEPGG